MAAPRCGNRRPATKPTPAWSCRTRPRAAGAVFASRLPALVQCGRRQGGRRPGLRISVYRAAADPHGRRAADRSAPCRAHVTPPPCQPSPKPQTSMATRPLWSSTAQRAALPTCATPSSSAGPPHPPRSWGGSAPAQPAHPQDRSGGMNAELLCDVLLKAGAEQDLDDRVGCVAVNETPAKAGALHDKFLAAAQTLATAPQRSRPRMQGGRARRDA